MNMRNAPVHVMAFVVKGEPPPVLRWKLCEFQHSKSISDSGINLIVWGGEIFVIKSGPKPLEKEIKVILGSKREDQFSKPFFTRNLCEGPQTIQKFLQKCQKIAGY